MYLFKIQSIVSMLLPVLISINVLLIYFVRKKIAAKFNKIITVNE